MKSDIFEPIERALAAIRAPIAPDEYDLHARVAEALAESGLIAKHEYKLAPRCRVDFICDGIGIEIKRERPQRARLYAQCEKYLRSPELKALLVVSPRAIALPERICDKPVRAFSLNRLWGVALP